MASEQFIGNWKLDKTKREGHEAFMLAHGYTTEQAAKVRETEVIVSIGKDGNGWKTTIKAGDFTGTVAWEIGKEFETKDMFGNPAKATITIDGDCLVENCTLKTPKADSRLKIRAYVNGNCMERYMEDSDGNKIKDVYIRI